MMPGQPAADEATRLVAALAALDLREWPPAAVHALLALAVRAHGALAERDESATFVAGDALTATDAVRAASAILRAAQLEPFELALWQTFGGLPRADHHGRPDR